MSSYRVTELGWRQAMRWDIEDHLHGDSTGLLQDFVNPSSHLGQRLIDHDIDYARKQNNFRLESIDRFLRGNDESQRRREEKGDYSCGGG